MQIKNDIKVRDMRHQLEMTQEEFAQELGITVSTVNRWENGHSNPSKLARATLERMASRHGVVVSDALIERDFGCSAPEFLAQFTHADEGVKKQAKRKARAVQKRFKGLNGVFVLGGGADGATLTLLDAPDAEPSPQKR